MHVSCCALFWPAQRYIPPRATSVVNVFLIFIQRDRRVRPPPGSVNCAPRLGARITFVTAVPGAHVCVFVYTSTRPHVRELKATWYVNAREKRMQRKVEVPRTLHPSQKCVCLA